MQETDKLVLAVAAVLQDIGTELGMQATDSDAVFLARAALQAIEGSGYIVVPAEVTDEMLNAAQDRLCQITNPTYFNDHNQAEMFKAMLAARPKVTPYVPPVGRLPRHPHED
jgi:hypothetical protein